MSGYWHDVNHTSVSTYPAGSLLPGYDEPVDEDCVALALAGDEVTVIEGEKGEVIALLQQAIARLEERESTDLIPPDALPEDTWYWPEEFEDQPDFITTDGGETWTPLCGQCSRRMTPLRNGNPQANWECDNYDAHGLSLALIWAEDWPNYEEEPSCWECGREDRPLTDEDEQGRRFCDRHDPGEDYEEEDED